MRLLQTSCQSSSGAQSLFSVLHGMCLRTHTTTRQGQRIRYICRRNEEVQIGCEEQPAPLHNSRHHGFMAQHREITLAEDLLQPKRDLLPNRHLAAGLQHRQALSFNLRPARNVKAMRTTPEDAALLHLHDNRIVSQSMVVSICRVRLAL